jgi:hypothetical protein
MLSAEDGIADTIVPRLIGAGADRTRITAVSGVETTDGRKTFDLKADIDLLEKNVRDIGDVKLIIIDPVSAYMGKVDGHGNVETRSVLEPIADMADRLRIAVVAVTHLNKGGTGSQGVLERFQGSIAFIAAARSGFAVIPDDENEGRVLVLSVKNNLAPMAKGLAFRCLQTIVGDGIVASAIDWENEHVSRTADEALCAIEAGAQSRNSTAKDEAIEFLNTILACGPVDVQDVERQARDAGVLGDRQPISQCKPIRAARESLGIKPRQVDRKWVWALPADSQMPSDAQMPYPQGRASEPWRASDPDLGKEAASNDPTPRYRSPHAGASDEGRRPAEGAWVD